MTQLAPGTGLQHPATGADLVSAPVLGADTGALTLRQADADAGALVRALLARGALGGAVVATHLTRLGAVPHVTLSVEAPALRPAQLAELVGQALPEAALGSPAADAGRTAHTARSSGRAVHFPGVDAIPDELTVAGLLSCCAVDAVRVVGGTGPVDPAMALVTRGHVRPWFDDGRLVLHVERAVGDRLVPFETPNPTPCCGDHG